MGRAFSVTSDDDERRVRKESSGNILGMITLPIAMPASVIKQGKRKDYTTQGVTPARSRLATSNIAKRHRQNGHKLTQAGDARGGLQFIEFEIEEYGIDGRKNTLHQYEYGRPRKGRPVTVPFSKRTMLGRRRHTEIARILGERKAKETNEEFLGMVASTSRWILDSGSGF